MNVFLFTREHLCFVAGGSDFKKEKGPAGVDMLFNQKEGFFDEGRGVKLLLFGNKLQNSIWSVRRGNLQKLARGTILVAVTFPLSCYSSTSAIL